MRTIARYVSILLVIGILLGSTGCYVLWDRDRHERRDDRDHRDYSRFAKRQLGGHIVHLGECVHRCRLLHGQRRALDDVGGALGRDQLDAWELIPCRARCVVRCLG